MCIVCTGLVCLLEGPAAAVNLTQAADGVENDRGFVNGELRNVKARLLFGVQAGSDPVVDIGRKRTRLGDGYGGKVLRADADLLEKEVELWVSLHCLSSEGQRVTVKYLQEDA